MEEIVSLIEILQNYDFTPFMHPGFDFENRMRKRTHTVTDVIK